MKNYVLFYWHPNAQSILCKFIISWKWLSPKIMVSFCLNIIAYLLNDIVRSHIFWPLETLWKKQCVLLLLSCKWMAQFIPDCSKWSNFCCYQRQIVTSSLHGVFLDEQSGTDSHADMLSSWERREISTPVKYCVQMLKWKGCWKMPVLSF